MNEVITPVAGSALEDKYRLGAVVRRSVRSTVYETLFAEATGEMRPAVIKMREIEEAGAEPGVTRWRDAMELSHPNLLRIYDAGTSTMEGARIEYVVMERAEESLAGVLAWRTLTQNEVREMLLPALDALQYLHKQGFAHGGLKPTNVLAAGDRLKLTTDNAVRFENGGSAAEDVRALGALVLVALTRKGPDEFAGNVYDVAAPFADVIRNCLEPDPSKRWNTEEIEARLNARRVPPVVTMPPVVRPASVEAPAKPVPVPEVRQPVGMKLEALDPEAPARTVPAADVPEVLSEDAAAQSRRTPLWIFAGLVAVVLLVLAGAALRKGDKGAPAAAQPTAVTPSSATSAAVVQAPAPQTPASEAPASQTLPAAPVAKPTPLPAPPLKTPSAASHPGGRKENGWAVIVAAYGSREAADKRERSLSATSPGFHFSVVEQRSERAPFIVVLGDNLSEAQAESLRQRAANAGLPPDTYIKRLAQ